MPLDAFYFEINGVNIIPYLAYRGIKWQRNDLDDSEAGRTMDGVMHRARVATKIRMDLEFKPLTYDSARVVLNLVYPEYVTVHYRDPMQGEVTKVMYSNSNSATHMHIDDNGVEWWHDIKVCLIEQ